MEISKSDWKLFREKLPDWQENYVERLLKRYIKNLKCFVALKLFRFFVIPID